MAETVHTHAHIPGCVLGHHPMDTPCIAAPGNGSDQDMSDLHAYEVTLRVMVPMMADGFGMAAAVVSEQVRQALKVAAEVTAVVHCCASC